MKSTFTNNKRKQARDARLKLGELCLAKRVTSSDDMLDIVKVHGTLLHNMEEFWHLEAAILRDLCGTGAEARASVSILQCLPTADRHIEMAQSLQRLEALSASPAMRLSPTGVQVGLRYIVSQLSSMQMGVAMNADPDTTSSLVKKALQHFGFFLIVQVKEEGKKAPKVLKGEAAYSALVTQAGEDWTAKTEISPTVFDQLQLYFWLCGPGLEAAAKQLIKEIAASESQAKKKAKTGGGVASVGGSSSSKSGAAGKEGKKTDLDKKNAGKAAAMRYFG